MRGGVSRCRGTIPRRRGLGPRTHQGGCCGTGGELPGPHHIQHHEPVTAPDGTPHGTPPSGAGPTDVEVLQSCQVSDSGNLYVVGCLERRVTLYSQQVRALNLVSALIDAGRITRETKVAIVGGGAAGLTAAAAIAVAVPDVQTLDVYERKPEPLHLQLRSRDRYLHPHLYDWPQPGSLQQTAGLPLLDWSAGSAGEVAQQILQEFERITASTRIRLQTEQRVDRIEDFGPGMGCRLRVASHSASGYRYDICLLCIGFGDELLSSGNERNHSYWDANLSASPLRGAADSQSIFVSGRGDGGLVDFMIAAFDGRSHAEILQLVTGHPGLAEVERVLLEVEAEVWQPGSTLDIEDAYHRRLRPVLPATLLADVAAALRRNADVLLHTRDRHLFRKDTAVLNRFIVFLALAASHQYGLHALRRVTDCEISGDPLDPAFRLTDGTRVRPDRRYLRFGTDTATHHAPFKAHIDAFAARRPTETEAFRPATPQLSNSARERFATIPTRRTATSASLPATAPLPASGPSIPNSTASPPPFQSETVVRLAKAPNGSVNWWSAIPSADARRLWTNGAPPLRIRCEMNPEEAGPLRFAIARLIAHARDYRLYCRNSHAWAAFLRAFYGENRPGPAVDFRFQARLCVDDVADDGSPEVASLYELASRIHLSLDHDVLARLNEALEAGLRPDAQVTAGWSIERGLRSAMLARWREWHVRLLESDAQRRRFLVLLVSPDDATDIGLAGLVRVGPKCVDAHLLRGALLALAFSITREPGLQPCGSFPGNLGVPSLSAHALGVSWLDGVDVGPEARERTWSTDVVLLSELQVAPINPPALPRLDHSDDSAEGIQGLPVHEQALVIGCTQAVRAALSVGESAVRAHFADLLRGHARAAARAIG
jgi:hypothetical protein